jgi:outer membrane protein assembly factor BamB
MTGKPLWTVDLAIDTASFQSISMADGVVVVQTRDRVRGYSTTDGKPLWSQLLGSDGPGHCTLVHSVASGDRALVVTRCLSGGSRGAITALDVQTGRIVWTHDVTVDEGNALFAEVVSVRPAIVAVHAIPGAVSMLVLDDHSGKRSQLIPAPTVKGKKTNFTSDGVPDSTNGGMFGYPVATFGGKLYATTGLGFGGGVVAVDLATGQPAWSAQTGTGGGETVVKVDATGLLVYEAIYGQLPRLVRFDLADGRRHAGPTLPASLHPAGIGRRILTHDDKIIFVTRHPSPVTPAIVVAGRAS